MRVVKETFDNIVRWLKEGSPDAKRPVDWDWDVDVVSKDEEAIIAEAFHPRAMLKLFIAAYPEHNLIKLAVIPGYPTKFLDNKEKLPLYYSLLTYNFKAPLVKAALSDEDDEVIFLVDLDARTLGKEEFNHALESLYYSVLAFAEAVGIQDEIMERYYDNVLEALEERMEKGESPEHLVEYLVEKVGVPRRKAEETVREMLARRGDKAAPSSLIM